MMERALIEYILNTLWQIPLLAGGAWLLLRIVRPSPQLQHGVWLTVLGLAVLLPMHGTVQPEPAVTPLQGENVLPDIARVRYAAVSPGRAPHMRRVLLGETSTRWLVRLYLATVVFSLFRIVQSWLAARHLVAGSREVTLGEANKRAFERYGQRLRVPLPRVRESDEVTSPMILGVAQPVLLLPEDFARFPASEVRAALCHELAHVQRRDYLGNLLCQLVALPVAWHPVVTAVQQRIRMTREMVCDAMAAREMESSLGYARSLLALARGLLGGLEIAEQAEFPGLFGNNRLEERVTRLMDTTTMNVRTRVARVLGGAVVTIATVSTATIFHVAPTLAESRPVAAQQVTQTAPVATEAQPAQAAPEPVTPAAPSERPRIIIRKRAPKTAEQAREEKEFKQRVEELQLQASRMSAVFDSPEFKLQIEDAQRQAAKAQIMLDSPAFKRQLEEARQEALQAQTMINSPEFKRQIEEAQQQALKTQTMLDSPEFKRQIQEAGQQGRKAQALLNSPEFKRQLDQARKQMLEAQTMMKQEMKGAEAPRQLNKESEEERTK